MQTAERAVLVGISRKSGRRRLEEESLRELGELARSAGAVVVGTFIQEREHPDPAYLIGAGKLSSIGEAISEHQADLVIFDEELTSAQLRNLEEFLQIKVVDRTELILDIFAQRASSREGKLQVELAQLEYLLPRLTGKGLVMSRLGGGIGTRGPGETKLEVDRRTIRGRIDRVRRELEKLEQRRSLQRRKRKGVPIPVVSLAGYTNAGKSTLFNRLAREEVFVSSRMFATLDPLVRRVTLEGGQEILLSDTVGFVRKLPHHLVLAFHATLEETLEADLILHVIDVSQENHVSLKKAVYEVLEEIGLTDKPILEVYNKTDLLRGLPGLDPSREHILVSARTGEGCEELLRKIESMITRSFHLVDLKIPFNRGDVVAQLRERARVESEEYSEDGIHLRVSVPLADVGRFRQFVDSSAYVSSRHHRKTQRR